MSDINNLNVNECSSREFLKGFRNGQSLKFRKKNRKKIVNQPPSMIAPELIEPNKVFVANISRTVNYKALTNYLKKFVQVVSVIIVKKSGPSYGFVQLANVEDTQMILNLDSSLRYLHGNVMHFHPAKRQIKLPGSVGFQRIPLSEREFDLEPSNPDAPCIHSLIDDVIFKIFDFLPAKSLIGVERVCRRWQNLLYSMFRKKACVDMKDDMNLWIKRNSLPSNAIYKVLTLCGESLKELSLGVADFWPHAKFLRTIGQLCPALESLSLSAVVGVKPDLLEDFAISCRNLKKFEVKGDSSFDDKNLEIVFSHWPHLEVLQLSEAHISSGKCFLLLPQSLKVLIINVCFDVYENYVCEIASRCPNLEVLRLDTVSIPSSVLKVLSEKCPNLRELGFTIIEEMDMSTFTNVKNLCLCGTCYSVMKLIRSLPQIEVLKLDGTILEAGADTIDFSALSNLKILVLPWNNNFALDNSALKSISYCHKLEMFKYKGCNEHKDSVLQIIRRCSCLKELYVPTITLCADDIQAFVDANKGRTERLKIVIGLDHSALDQIEKLNDAKYDIDMFDAHNLFREFDVYDDLEDDLYYDSEGSYSSFDEEDLYDFHYLLPPQYNGLWGDPLDFLVVNPDSSQDNDFD